MQKTSDPVRGLDRPPARLPEWLIERLACPTDESGFEVVDDDGLGGTNLRCAKGHLFHSQAGVPVLLGDIAKDVAKARASFSREWDAYAEGDRTWGWKVEERRERVVKLVARLGLSGSNLVVLDAGCGNGSLTCSLANLGWSVLGIDISSSVFRARAACSEARAVYIQGDLTHLPLQAERFDFVLCSGVIHHTPAPLETLKGLSRAVRRGGGLYCWVYRRRKGPLIWVWRNIYGGFRNLPGPVQEMVGRGAVNLVRAQQAVMRGRQLSKGEALVRFYDSFTPPYAYEFTEEEILASFEKNGFEKCFVTDENDSGFAVVGLRG